MFRFVWDVGEGWNQREWLASLDPLPESEGQAGPSWLAHQERARLAPQKGQTVDSCFTSFPQLGQKGTCLPGSCNAPLFYLSG